MVDIDKPLRDVVDAGASDLHLAVSNQPVVRINGDLHIVKNGAVLTQQDTEGVLQAITSEENVAVFHRDKELDFSYGHPELARFRVNASYQRGTISLSIRILPPEIPSADELGLPSICLDLVSRLQGLVLVTGSTGSGKSTTLAAMINYLNESASCRIITLEDPIEYIHQNKRSMIIQRELGGDTHSFSEALRRALRQDPDVIMVGELRDVESVSLALIAAETGHLVLSTLHTNGAADCVERLVSISPAEQQQQVQFQLSIGLTAVIYQVLLPRPSGKGRIAAFEVMAGTNAIRNLIRQNQISQIASYIFMGAKFGMQTLEQSMMALVQNGDVSVEEAFNRANDRPTLERLMDLEGIFVPLELRSGRVARPEKGLNPE